MKLGSKALIFTLTTLMVVFLTGLAFVTQDATVSAQAPAAGARPAPAPAGPKPQMSEDVYKNVTVLKGIPVDEFLGTMGVFSTSLTLCCGNCHTGAGTSNPKWEDDPPLKRTTRRMVTMVQKINKDNFNGRQVVTCWTCHHGSTSPSVTAPLDFAYGDSQPQLPDVLRKAVQGAAPSLDQILDKYIQALGGAAQVAKLTSYVAKGTSILYGDVGKGDPAEIYAKAPNGFAMLIHQPDGDVARTFDGKEAWFQLPLTVTPQYPLLATYRDGAAFDAAMAFPWKIKDFFTNWRVADPTRIDDVEVNVIQGSTPAGMIGTLYFDKQTGLLKRMIRYANSAVGRVPTQIDYSDYRPVAGVQMPFSFNYTWVSQRDSWTLTEYQPNVQIDGAKFGKPVLRAAK